MAVVQERLSPDEILGRVERVLDGMITASRLNFGHADVTCEPDRLVDVVTTLRNHEDTRTVFFTFLSAIDRSTFGDEESDGRGELEVLVHLYSPELVLHVNVHVPLPMDSPTCASISGVFRGAEWHERETHEMFGIAFEGHPGLTNLYLPEDFEGRPLLKSFRLPSRFVKDWPGAKDPEEAAGGGRG